MAVCLARRQQRGRPKGTFDVLRAVWQRILLDFLSHASHGMAQGCGLVGHAASELLLIHGMYGP